MRIDPNLITFLGHPEWYTHKKGLGYVPTELAPKEAAEAMEKYNSYSDNRYGRKLQSKEHREYKTVGYFSEMNLHCDNGSIKEHLRDCVAYDKEAVCEYLKRQKILGVYPRDIIDCLTGDVIASNLTIMSDGTYKYPASLIYHVENYNIDLPDEFISNMDIDSGDKLGTE